MSEFRIVISIDKNLFKSKEKREIIYYTRDERDYVDDVSFYRRQIIISGTRTKPIAKTDLLETTNSTYYSVIVKSLLYVYFREDKFNVNSINIFIDNTLFLHYRKKDIRQDFNSDPLLKIDPEKLFSNKKISDITMNCLMNITLSCKLQDQQFDYAWRCFNALFRECFDNLTEHAKLKALRVDLTNNHFHYPSIYNFASTLEVPYMDKCFFNAMICNNYPKGGKNTIRNLEEFFKSFEDYRVSAVLKEKMKCKKRELISAGKYNEIESFLNANISNGTVNNVDIIRIILLKYAYYLRCKYFHGEKIPPNFLILNMNQIELNRISIPLRIICKDIIENKL